MDSLNIESLAAAIQECHWDAVRLVTGLTLKMEDQPRGLSPRNFDELSEKYKSVRRETARLLLERIMR